MWVHWGGALPDPFKRGVAFETGCFCGLSMRLSPHRGFLVVVCPPTLMGLGKPVSGDNGNEVFPIHGCFASGTLWGYLFAASTSTAGVRSRARVF